MYLVMTTIGIIGAGRIGSQVARLAVASGYKVVISKSPTHRYDSFCRTDDRRLIAVRPSIILVNGRVADLYVSHCQEKKRLS
jgi:phosphoglycerate dehydrogenase-like enzyme